MLINMIFNKLFIAHIKIKISYLSMQNQTQSKEIANKINLIVSVGASIKKWSSLTGKSKDRYYRLKELVETQLKYKIDLELIQQKIQKPLKQSNFISEYQEKEMFPNLDGMINLSKQIYQEMNQLFISWNRKTTLIAPTMIKYSKFMLVYSDLFKNYQNTERKLKNLLQNHKEVQQIQRNMSSQSNTLLTFQILMSKPFQRPLKYHLLLKEYCKQTPKNHPDYKNLEQAIQKYHQVNQRNNSAMQHKEKDKMLMYLDKIFTEIIGSQARYFILECQAHVFNQKVKCYLLSDLLLISKQQGYKEIEYARVVINEQSYSSAIKNGIHLKNGLLVCGKKNCIYLSFSEMSQRDKFLHILNRIITDAYKNKHFKEQVRGSRRSTMSSMSFRETATNLQELRGIMTKLQTTLPQPPRIIVIGYIKRAYSSKNVKVYFLTKFQQSHPSDHSQMLYIDQDDMNMIQRIAKNLYSRQKDFLQIPCLQDLAKLMQSGGQAKILQYKTIYYTLLLNSIFRHTQISKRTDIFMQKMDVFQGLWVFLKYSGCQCPCYNCSQGQVVNTIQKYNQQIKKRYQSRQIPLTFYCPLRTYRTQDTISTMTAQQVKDIQSPNDRIFWIKCKRGDTQYRLQDSTFTDMSQSKEVLFHLCGKEDKKYQRNVKRHDRVGQIKCTLGKQINIDLAEYQMSMQINKVTYLLGDDQVLFKVLSNEVPNEQGFASFFKSAFVNKQDNRIKIYLKRIWWLSDVWLTYTQRIETQIKLFMQEMVYRLKNQEIQLSVNDTMVFYACYFIFSEGIKQQTDITLNSLESLVSPKKWKLLTSKNKEQQLDVTRIKFKGLSQKFFSQVQGIALKKKVLEYTIKFLKGKSVFGVYFFEATYAKDGKQVKLGFDFTSFIVKQCQKMVVVYQSKIAQVRQKLIVSGDELRIVQQETEYQFINGSCFVQMVELLDLFIQYSKTFLQTTS